MSGQAARMADRRLSALGLDGVPVLDPLSYPGRPVPGPSLLLGEELLTLRPVDGPVGRWRTEPDGAELDAVLRESGSAGVADRLPVLAVGSNASPGQMRHKLLAAGLPVALPMVPVTAGGIGIGVSGHISVFGYVSASPYAEPGCGSAPVVCWLDPDQLTAVDATEPNYRRVLLPADRFPVTLPGGTPLPEPWLYVNRHGVLALDGRTPRPGGEQRALLRELLAASGRLRTLMGPGPRTWVARVTADPAVRAEGNQLFADEGWLLPQESLLALE